MDTIHNSFTKGQLTPTLNARVDSDIYTKGARELTNMFSLWTGATRIAPGLNYLDIMVDRTNTNAPITNNAYVNGFDFLFDAGEDVIYTIILRQDNTTSSAIDIYYNNILQATVTTPTYLVAEISKVKFVQSHDRVLFLHESYPPQQLIRGASHNTWTFSPFVFNVLPSFDFTTIGKAPTYRGITFTLASVAVANSIALTASAAIFNSGHVGGWLIGKGGVAYITAVASTTAATVNIVQAFTATAVPGDNASLREVMWGNHTATGPVNGANRGYPARGVFYLNRLILGRTAQLKNVSTFSTAAVYDDFDEFGEPIDASTAFTIALNGKGEQSIQSIVADDSLIFLTSGKIFASSPLVETPLTALNAYFPPQTKSPSSDVEAVSIDNQILFSGHNSTVVNRAIYSTQVAKYIGSPASILSSNLLTGINSNATWEPEDVETKLYLATQADGSMLMYSTLIEQDISAWSKRNTKGEFIQVMGEGLQASVLVNRQINLGITTFETSLDYAYQSDSSFGACYNVQAILAAPTTTVTVFENQNDYLVLGNDIPFTAINITMNTVASSDCALTFQYLDLNKFWVTLTPTDNTTGLTASGSVTWNFTDVANWQPQEVCKVKEKFWIRIRRTAETLSTLPVMEQIQVNTGKRIYIENFDFSNYMDSKLLVTSSATGAVTGLSNLKGHQVYARANGSTFGPFFVDENGATNIVNEYPAVEIGIQFKPKLIPMPLFAPTQEGYNTYAEKYVQDLFIDYHESLYLQAGIGDRITDIPNMKLSDYTLGESVPPQTGFYAINPRGGWDPRQEVVVTQSQPGPMTIIGIGYNLEVT